MDFLNETVHATHSNSERKEGRGSIPAICWVAAGSWKTTRKPYAAGDAEEWIESDVK